MSYNGSGTFNINTAGQPVVTGTVISSTTFNLLTSDLATGLSTAMTKDGQTTATANIPMGTFKFTGLGAGTNATDSAQYGQLQAGATNIATVTGTDTLTGSLTPAITAYATGNLFSFVAANTNTGAATINLNSLGAKNITKFGSTALTAGDILSGQVHLIEYDGTRFQLFNPNSLSSILSPTAGGTGVSNNAAMTVTGSGNFAYTRTLTGTTNVTFPTTGTLATLAGTETFTNKNLGSCTVDGTNTVGFLTIPQNSQSAAYTLVLADAGKHIFHPSTDANARTYTIPANSSVAYLIGTAITFVNMTSQVVTIAITTDTMYLAKDGTTGSRSLAQYGSATALKMTSTTWLISGSALT